MTRPPPSSPLFPYTTLFRSRPQRRHGRVSPVVDQARRIAVGDRARGDAGDPDRERLAPSCRGAGGRGPADRSEEHTSELQSHSDLVCRLLLEKKKKKKDAKR